MSVACGGHALAHASKVALPLATLSATAGDLDVGLPEMGWAISAYTAGMALSSVPAGLASDRWGPGPVLSLYFWLTALACVACALAPSYGLFLAAHAVLGLAAGMFHPPGLGLVSMGVPAERVGRAMGTFGIAAGLGTALVPLAMGTSAGWRVGFLMLAFVGFLGAGACFWLRRVGLLPRGQAVAPAGALEGSAARRGLVLLLLAMAANAFCASAFETVFPDHLAARAATSEAGWLGGGELSAPGSRLAVIVLALGGLGQWVGGLLAGGRLAGVRYALLIMAQPLFVLLLVRNLDAQLAAVVWPMALFTFVNTATQPVENKLLAAFTSTRRRSTAFALKFLVAVAVAAPAPGLAGELYAESGLGAAYRLVAVASVVGLSVAVLFLRFGRGRSSEG